MLRFAMGLSLVLGLVMSAQSAFAENTLPPEGCAPLNDNLRTRFKCFVTDQPKQNFDIMWQIGYSYPFGAIYNAQGAFAESLVGETWCSGPRKLIGSRFYSHDRSILILTTSELRRIRVDLEDLSSSEISWQDAENSALLQGPAKRVKLTCEAAPGRF